MVVAVEDAVRVFSLFVFTRLGSLFSGYVEHSLRE